MTARRPWTPPLLARGTRTVTLTPRRAEVLTALCMGMSNVQIARRLFVTEHTAKSHVQHLLRVFKAMGRTQLVVLAMSGQVTVWVADPNNMDVPTQIRRAS